ncbi:DUF1566 domain-containing protein [Aeromonas veronii]|nr:DUF1566 domain-containing protein [Aeromonas veronii]
MINQRTYSCLLCLSLSGVLLLSEPAQANNYASCLAEKLQGITHDAAVKAITEACQVQYSNNTSSNPASTPAKAVVIDGRYHDNGNGTITDRKTNLTWMRCSLGQQWTGSTCAGVAMEINWNDALKTAMSFSYAGHSDWRVPTVDELDTLVQCSEGRAPLVRPNGEYQAIPMAVVLATTTKGRPLIPVLFQICQSRVILVIGRLRPMLVIVALRGSSTSVLVA